ncbi:unnamed protein product [Rotaria sordida]|uniref:Uncharacterized protein n=3 Tax=Rotaria sordida TaxID=392033 RepID=A0A815ALZ6_9BILA|nr:unnamed protein product [Rotaria sordida]
MMWEYFASLSLSFIVPYIINSFLCLLYRLTYKMGGSQSQHRPRFSHCQASYYGTTWDQRSYVPSHVGYGHHHHNTRQRLSFGSAPTHRRIRS